MKKKDTNCKKKPYDPKHSPNGTEKVKIEIKNTKTHKHRYKHTREKAQKHKSTKAQAQPGWRSAERPRCFLDLPTMVPAAASRTQPFIWLALALTFINLFDCVFYQLYLLVAGDPSKRYQTWLTISQFRIRAKNHMKETLLQPTLLKETTYI